MAYPLDREQRRLAKASRSAEATPLWHVIGGLAGPLLRRLIDFRITNPEKLPGTGAYVITPNHYSNLDPLTTGYLVWVMGRVPRFLAKASLFKKGPLGWLLRATGQIPVARSGSGRAGADRQQPLAAAADLVSQGHAVIIYPEGTLTRQPELWPMRGKTGAVRTALENDIPIIPMAHWGVQDIMPRYSKKLALFPRKTVRAIVGDPVDLDRFRGKPLESTLLAEATEAVMVEITRLLEELRGESAPAERWDPSKYGQSETGRFESA
ncbi:MULTISPECIES: lysophospholipid acyltransferase family protein [unclassified Salinibacterium]|uniref:lysophospholipid acyltransferase family protein n=1 Tax=unclassified Salinibacterium TaxID=2632331 RepID=UPI00141E8663|nr:MULTISPECIES: lysophospholipid acyltransferase family protein [unclassified Salinibacterium]